MRKISFSLAIASALLSSTLSGQVSQENTNQLQTLLPKCRQHDVQNQLLQDPQIRAMFEQARQAMDLRELEMRQETPTRVIYTVPVVFHILHQGGPENISKEQIEDAMRILNRDYRLQNADANNVAAPFNPAVTPSSICVPTDVGIEFALATKAPNGNCFSGITRTYTALTNDGSSGQAQINAVIAGNDVYQGVWPYNKYLNILICADIGGAAGYTFNPMGGGTTSSQGMYFNSVFALHNYVGSIGTSSDFTSRTLTHECGHWFNLSHTWGDNNNPGSASSCGEDDHVQDTPLCIGVTSCALSENSCNDTNDPNNYSSWSFDVVDNVENYMDYSYCSKMFSGDQVTRMRAAITESSTNRANVWSASNLAAVGVGTAPTLCQAKFLADKQIVCPGSTVTFTDQSYNAATGWTWSFPGGTPSTSTAQNPSVVYNTPGVYQVQLTATDGTSSDVETQAAYITVLPSSEGLSFVEGFEGISTFTGATRWHVENPGGIGWTVSTNAGASGTHSAMITNFGQASDQEDDLMSAPIDLSSVTAADGLTLSFKYAYRKKASANSDQLQVLVTANCGSSWEVRKTLSSSTMSQGQTATSSWTPVSTDFVTVNMTNISSSYWVSNFRFMFKFLSGGGNNIYIDDINLYKANDPNLGLNENTLNELSVYPNPADEMVNIRFQLPAAQKVNLVVTDLIGNILESKAIQGGEGDNIIMVGTSDYATGMYMIRLNNGTSVPFMVK